MWSSAWMTTSLHRTPWKKAERFWKLSPCPFRKRKSIRYELSSGVSKFLPKFGGEFGSTQRPTQNVRKQVRVTETEFRFMYPTFMTSNFPPNLRVITTGPGKPQGNHPFPPSPSAVQLSKGACHRGDQQIIATLSNNLNPSIWAPTTVYGEKLYKKISVSLVVVDIYIYIYIGKLL